MYKLSEKISLAFVDDHPMLLEGMSTIFSYHERFEISGLGSSAMDAAAIAKDKKPDLIFMDLSMPGDVISTIAEIVSGSEIKVAVFTAFSSVDAALKALDAGATGFILKGGRIEEVFDAVEAIMNGEMYITKQFASQVISGLQGRSQRGEISGAISLSPKEKQVVQLLNSGCTNREIAGKLSISEQTVKYHIKSLMRKLKARNRLDVVIEAQIAGILE
jgi:DNA-binding NarL/FixJ family response regulator